MKSCPACAESIQDAAVKCRFCGYEFAAEQVARELAADRDVAARKTVFISVLVVILGIFMIRCSVRQGADAPAPAPLTATQIAACQDVVRKARRAAVIVEEPSATRVNVEERRWAELSAGAKSGVLQAVACANFGRKLGTGDYVVAYGYRSGKRIAMLTSAGLDLE